MPSIYVDQEKCKKDGLCAADCPMQIIVMDKESGFPQLVKGAEEYCISCGHCVAVCPHGALDHDLMKASECMDIPKDMNLGEDVTEVFLRRRRSIRQYKELTVPKLEMEKLIRIASFAPSGHNYQPLSWSVYEGKEKLTQVIEGVIQWMKWMMKEQPAIAQAMHMDLVVDSWKQGVDRVLRGAPALVVVHGPTADRTVPAAGITAITYLELAAPGLGLGSCWAGFFNAAAQTFPPLQKILDLPEGHKSVAAVMVGYPKAKYFRMPKRNDPRISWK